MPVKASVFQIFPGQNAVTNTVNMQSALLAMKNDKISLMFEEDGKIPYDFAGNGTSTTGLFELGFQDATMFGDGPKVTLRHQGTGIFFSAQKVYGNPSADAAKNLRIGSEFPLNIKGNPAGGTHTVFFADKIADSRINIRPRDALINFRAQNAVCCEFDITQSFNWDAVPNAVDSIYGAFLYKAFSCGMRLNIEGAGGRIDGQQATYMDECVRNKLRVGSSAESCGHGGLYMTTTCNQNTIEGVDNEVCGVKAGDPVNVQTNQNPTGPDQFDTVCHGSQNHFLTLASKMKLTGNYNTVAHSTFQPGSIIDPSVLGAVKNLIDACNTAGLTDNSASTIIRRSPPMADKN